MNVRIEVAGGGDIPLHTVGAVRDGAMVFARWTAAGDKSIETVATFCRDVVDARLRDPLATIVPIPRDAWEHAGHAPCGYLASTDRRASALGWACLRAGISRDHLTAAEDLHALQARLQPRGLALPPHIDAVYRTGNAETQIFNANYGRPKNDRRPKNNRGTARWPTASGRRYEADVVQAGRAIGLAFVFVDGQDVDDA